MITLENLVAFLCGLLVVYVMFRAMGVFVFVAFLGLVTSASAQIAITNWPDSTSPLPVVTSVDVWPAAAAGFGFGLTVCGFGWVLRTYKKIGSYHD
jgi:hypothetical protein